MSNQCKGVREDLVLIEEGQEVVNDQRNASDMLHDVYTNVTSDIGERNAIKEKELNCNCRASL